QREATRHLPGFALLHHRRDRALTAHPDQRDALRTSLDRVVVCQRVRRVRIPTASRGDDVLPRAGDARNGLPRGSVALEVRHERGVDDVVLEAVQQDRRYQPAVLANVVEHRIACPRQHDVLVDARHLIGLTNPAEQVLVDLRLPHLEAWARPRAARAALLAMTAIVGAETLLELERLVSPLVRSIAEHVVRARDHTPGAARAEAARDPLLVEVLPLELLGGHPRSLSPLRLREPLVEQDALYDGRLAQPVDDHVRN